jgi:hypothetical protein
MINSRCPIDVRCRDGDFGEAHLLTTIATFSLRAILKIVEPIWKEFAGKLSDRFLELGNIAVGAIIFGQFISEQGFQWGLTLLGIGLWGFFSIMSYLFLRWSKPKGGA